jgi:hypothetical protein
LHACSLRDSAPRPRESKDIISESLRAVYAEVCEELNRLGYRTRTGKPWRHPQQIIKLLRSFSASC